MAAFDRAIATAQRVIAKYGQAVIWRKVNDAANTAEPWKPIESPDVDHDVNICFVPIVDAQWRKLLQYLKDTEVPAGKLCGLMGAVDFEPKLKDVVVRDGVTLRISSIDLLSPNGQKVLYTVEFEE